MAEQRYWNQMWSRRASRRSILRATGVAGAGLAGAALIGCGDDDDEPTPTQPPGATQPPAGAATPGAAPTQAPPSGGPQQGGHIRLAIQALPQENFNTVTNTTEGNFISTQHVYDSLLSPRVGLPYEDSLRAAESVEVIDDLTFRFTLKEGLVYQDREPANGRAVRAEDIAVMQEYVRDSDTAIDRSFQTNILDNVETPDDRTVIYHLQRPYAYIFSGAALGYAHNNIIAPAELITGDFNSTPPVGSGPYQITNYQFQVQYDFERNPTFRDADRGLPYIDQVTRVVMTDGTALETAFRGEQLTVYYAPPPEIADRLIADLGDRISVVEFLSLAPVQSSMSSKRDWTQDIRAREATYRMMNLDEYIDLILDGRGIPNTSMVQQGLTPYLLDDSETAPYRRYDEAEARALFEAAGFDFEAERELTTIQGGGAGRNELGLQVLQEQLRRIGIRNVTYDKVQPVGEWLANVTSTGQFDWSLVANQASDVPQRMLRLNHTNTLTPHDSTNIRDPEVDALIEASEQEINYEAHIDLVKDLQRTLMAKYAHTQLVWAAQDRQLHWGYLHDFEAARQIVSMHNAEAWMEL